MRTDRRRFLVASAIGALLAFVAISWILTIGWSDLLARENYGNFYDAQAHSLLAGHWDVPSQALFYEGFRLHGKTFTYFGVWPSVARIPILEVAPSLSGRLTRVSMLGAFAVFLGAVVALHWRIRSLFRGRAAVGRTDLILGVAIPVVAGCGSCAVFLASRAWVYHEAIIWGVAWALVAYERLIAFLSRPSVLRLVAVSAAATLTISSRAPIGFGVTAALGLAGLGALVQPVGERGSIHPHWDRTRRAVASFGPQRTGSISRRRRLVFGIALATAVPLAVSAYVNWSRFGTLFSVPWRHQVLFIEQPNYARSLDANGGSYFSLSYVPTTLLQYLRPDALARTALFPWVTFQRFHSTVVGDVIVDGVDYSSSVPASMPALAVLTVLGFGAAFSRRISPATAALRAPLVGGLCGVGFVITIAFIAQRYLGDWLPLLIPGGIAGLYVLLGLRVRANSTRRRSVTTAALVVVAVLAVGGVWVNGSLSLLYQRLYNPQPDTLRAGMIGFQSDATRALGGSGAGDLTRVGHDLGRPAAADTSRIIGNCDAMYWSDGFVWHLVEGAPRGGVVLLHATRPPADHRWHPLVAWSSQGADTVIVARVVGSTFRIARAQRRTGEPATVTPNTIVLDVGHGRHDIEVVMVRALDLLRVRVDGKDALLTPFRAEQPDRFRIGTASLPGIAPDYGAPIGLLPARTGVCTRLLRRLG